MKLRRYLVYAALAATTGQAHAQTATSIRDEYARDISSAQTVAAFGPDLFGESVNLKDGVTSFSATDVTAATNSGLPVAVGRTLGVNAMDVDDYVDKLADGELFGNWKLDVPVIHGTFDERTGWVVGSSTPTLRCSSGYTPPPARSLFSAWNLSYLPEQYWHGNEVRIPGKGSYPLLALPSDRARPDDGQQYFWTTKDGWRVSCLPAVKNAAGEGFKVALPDGTKYTFDWMSSRKVAALKDKQCKSAYYNEYNVINWAFTYYTFDWDDVTPDDPNGRWRMNRMDGGAVSGGSRQVNFCREEVVVNRREYFLHATKVEDRFGNTVVYDYDPANPRRLRTITSSDGNAIGLSYGSNGKISAVTQNGRTWQYQYASADGATLSAVVRPDGSRWTFQYGDLYSMLHQDNQHILWLDCEPSVPGQATASVTIGHPSGAVGVFDFRSMAHGTDRVPGSCYQPDPDQSTHAVLTDVLMVYKAASLTSKQISGPGLATHTWTYDYSPHWSWNATGYVDDCSFPAANCDSTVKTDVTAPDGTVTRSTFGNDYWHNAGQLLKVETLSDGVPVQTVEHTYLASAAGQAFPDAAGVDPNPRNNRLVTEKNRPLSVTTTSRGGDHFTRSFNAFDAFVRPTRVTRANSLGFSKEEVTEYHDNLGLWVLGQVRRQYIPATSVNAAGGAGDVVFAETEYDAQALPSRRYAFGRLIQALSYAADGNVSSIADGNGNVTSLSDYYRGTPRLIRFPATAEAPSGAAQSATVDVNGWVSAVTDELGSRTCYGRDALGRIVRITYPSETQAGVCDASRWTPVSLQLTQVAAEEHGLPAGHWRLSRSEGNNSRNLYLDALWRPVLEETFDASDAGATSSQTVTRYDSKGRRSFVSNPQRGVDSYLDALAGTRTRYDALDRPVRVEVDNELDAAAPLATVTEYLDGLRTRVTNPRGFVSISSHLAWDEPGYDLPISRLMPEGKVVQIERHPKFGWPLRLTQRSADYAQQQTRRYVYDGHAQLCKSVEPEAGATVMGYDAAGNLTWSAAGLSQSSYAATDDCNHTQAWSSGRRVDRSYDARNRLLTLAFPDTLGNQIWTYTPDGLPASIVTSNEAGATAPVRLAYTYNRRRLPTAETLSQAGWYDWTIGHAYDSLGNLAAQTYPTGLNVDYAPNALGQATRAGSYVTDVRYHPNGAVQQFSYANGVVYTMRQNLRQLPAQMTASGVADQIYSYDANGNLTGIADRVRGSGYDRTMSYDPLDRLTAANSASFGGDAAHRFTYDALDNITSWRLGGIKDYDYVYAAGTNRLDAIRNGAGSVLRSFSYDAQGNLQTKDGQAFQFDVGNRLRQVAGKETYRYDGLGRRVQTTRADGSQALWHYSQAGQLLFSWDGPTRQQTHEYVYLAGRLVATIDHDWPANTTATVRYRHTDALGSTIAASDAAGQVVERNDYEPYGAVIGKPGFSGVGYTGHVMDGTTGLAYMQQRYYDADVGRFLSVDPVTADASGGGNFNRYWYGNDNPYSFVDPNGKLGEHWRCVTPGSCVPQQAMQRAQVFANYVSRKLEPLQPYVEPVSNFLVDSGEWVAHQSVEGVLKQVPGAGEHLASYYKDVIKPRIDGAVESAINGDAGPKAPSSSGDYVPTTVVITKPDGTRYEVNFGPRTPAPGDKPIEDKPSPPPEPKPEPQR
ncbi:RHS repeat domain-containing protein [Tahibacter caeni]|uniref:RHS repeat domain-containing protein n=1 Tax=Tahibacter caeni TaxID=1453545 RepID=UPI002148716E|nr:RHS repeat-associated core domain-containing protein [Tahibacter caeni]